MRGVRSIGLPLLGALVFGIGVVPAGPAHAATSDSTARRTHHDYPTVAVARTRYANTAHDEFVQAAFGVPGGPPLTYHGGLDGIGVTTGTPRVYVVFWGSQWGSASPEGSTNFLGDPLGVAPRVEALLAGIGTNDELWSGITTQYCQDVPAGTTVCPVNAPHVGYPTGGAVAGIWEDASHLAPANASGTEIATEAMNAAAHFGNTTPASNRSAQYVVVSPTGTHPDGFNAGANFCAWHDYAGASRSPSSPYGDISYTNLPYIPDMGPACGAGFVNAGPAGALDGVTMVEGHEYAETITDQNPAGGWIDQGGQEDADKCAWLANGPGRAQDVAFATGTFAMQGTWSNDGRQCLIAHPIWGLPGLPDDFEMDLAPRSGFATPGSETTAQFTSVTAAGNPQPIDLSASDLPPGATVSFSPPSLSSDGTSTATISTAPITPAGQYQITIAATGSVTHSTAFVLVVVDALPGVLQNGVAITGLAGGAGSDQYFAIDIPSGLHETDFTISSGTGDADIYVAQDSLPTDSDFVCGSSDVANLDSCLLFDVTGRWYVRVHGTSAFSDLVLRVTSTSATRMLNLSLPGWSGAVGSQQYFWMRVDPGAKSVKFAFSHQKGDADLYGRYGSLPSQFVDVCKPPKHGRHSESCSIKKPAPGIWYFALFGATDFTDLTIKAKVNY